MAASEATKRVHAKKSPPPMAAAVLFKVRTLFTLSLPTLLEMRQFCAAAKFAISACQKMDGLLVARSNRLADGETPRDGN